MRLLRLALIGFGNVGQGLATIIRDHGASIAAEQGVELRIVSVSTARRGGRYDPDGIDAGELLAALVRDGHLSPVDEAEAWPVERVLRESNADVVVETTPTDLQTAEPATSYLKLALENGRHVVTTNKGPVALHYPMLTALASQRGLSLGVEGTVMAGTPVMRLGGEALAGSGLRRIQGILNGTTNYMLEQMRSGANYSDALAEAQALGYAEADPTADVEGHDAAVKVVILGNLLLGGELTVADVPTIGISGLTPDDVADAEAAGECWKLIGLVERVNGVVRGKVAPVRLPLTDPLAAVGGATNAVTLSSDVLGDVTLSGPGAGRLETGFAIVADLLAIARSMAHSA